MPGVAEQRRKQVMEVSRDSAPPLIQAYLQSIEQTLRLDTIQTYHKKLDGFLEWWAKDAAKEALTDRLAQRYHRWLKERLARREISKRSVGLYLSAIRQWTAYLTAQGLIAENPCAALVGPGRAKGLTHSYLSLSEIKTLLAIFDRSQPVDQRDYVLCYLMLKTAVRPIELARANVSDIDARDGVTILYLHRKGTDDRTDSVELMPEVKRALDAYFRPRAYPTPKDPLFITHDRREDRRLSAKEIRRRVVLALKRAGLKRPSLSSLSLRQTAAMQALQNLAPLPAVQSLMRHESERTTQVYKDQLRQIRRGAERYLKY